MALGTHAVLGVTFSSTTFFVLQEVKFKANLLTYNAVLLNDCSQTFMHLFIATDSATDRPSIYSEIWSIYFYFLTLMTACTD